MKDNETVVSKAIDKFIHIRLSTSGTLILLYLLKSRSDCK